MKRTIKRKGVPKGAPTYEQWSKENEPTIETTKIIEDIVNHPKYYNAGKYETIDIIEDIISNYKIPQDVFLVGQVIKYLYRAPLKDIYVENLQKAQWYLNRLVERNKNDQN